MAHQTYPGTIILLGLNSFVSELDEQPTNGDDDDEDDSEDDDDDDDIIETPVGQITLPNGNRIDRASAGALQKPRNDIDQEDQVRNPDGIHSIKPFIHNFL